MTYNINEPLGLSNIFVFSDQFIIGLFVLLFVIGEVLLLYGLEKEDSFFYFFSYNVMLIMIVIISIPLIQLLLYGFAFFTKTVLLIAGIIGVKYALYYIVKNNKFKKH